uniref:Uncharacterized protein n=1 Tax=Anopheles coluzzii TaxID=1518534 RepID=A0A8W7PX61_ANOCL
MSLPVRPPIPVLALPDPSGEWGVPVVPLGDVNRFPSSAVSCSRFRRTFSSFRFMAYPPASRRSWNSVPFAATSGIWSISSAGMNAVCSPPAPQSTTPGGSIAFGPVPVLTTAPGTSCPSPVPAAADAPCAMLSKFVPPRFIEDITDNGRVTVNPSACIRLVVPYCCELASLPSGATDSFRRFVLGSITIEVCSGRTAPVATGSSLGNCDASSSEPVFGMTICCCCCWGIVAGRAVAFAWACWAGPSLDWLDFSELDRWCTLDDFDDWLDDPPVELPMSALSSRITLPHCRSVCTVRAVLLLLPALPCFDCAGKLFCPAGAACAFPWFCCTSTLSSSLSTVGCGRKGVMKLCVFVRMRERERKVSDTYQ